MGPKGKDIKENPSKQAKGRKRNEGDEERERGGGGGGGERAIRPQHAVDAEAMETVSDHEEEDEQLGPEEEDEVTGKQRKEK